MKRIFLFAALLTAAVAETFACTNLIVGKNASTDGSTIVSYSADSYGLFGELYHYPAATYPKGTMMDIHENGIPANIWDRSNRHARLIM